MRANYRQAARELLNRATSENDGRFPQPTEAEVQERLARQRARDTVLSYGCLTCCGASRVVQETGGATIACPLLGDFSSRLPAEGNARSLAEKCAIPTLYRQVGEGKPAPAEWEVLDLVPFHVSPEVYAHVGAKPPEERDPAGGAGPEAGAGAGPDAAPSAK